MDKPTNTPVAAAGSPRRSATAPSEQRRQGAMGERRVSDPPPVRASEQAGGIAAAAGPYRVLRSRTAAAGAPVPPGAATRVHSGLPGAADRPPGSAEQAMGFLATWSVMCSIRSRYPLEAHMDIHADLDRARESLKRYIKQRFVSFGGDFRKLAYSPNLGTKAVQAYGSLRQKAACAEDVGDTAQATAIRMTLNEIDLHAAEVVRRLVVKHGHAVPSSVRRPRTPPAAEVPLWDWCTVHRNLLGISKYFDRAGLGKDAGRFRKCNSRLTDQVNRRFRIFGGTDDVLLPLCSGHSSRPEQKYRALEGMARKAEAASGAGEVPRICKSLNDLNSKAREELRLLAVSYGSLEDLAARAGRTERQASVTAGPGATPATAQVTAAPPLQHLNPAPGSVSADTRTATVPGSQVPLAQREAIVERFSSEDVVFHARLALGTGAINTLVWSHARAEGVLADLGVLNNAVAEDPATAASTGTASRRWSARWTIRPHCRQRHRLSDKPR